MATTVRAQLQRWRLVLVWIAVTSAATAIAQETAEGPNVGDEVIVRGVTPAFLRRERELAENRMYALFNELNSRDEFDIHCHDEAPLGTRITQRVCLPNFVSRANADASRDVIYGLTGGYGGNPDIYYADRPRKFKRMQQEMAKLMAEHPEFASAVVRMVDLQRMRAADDEGEADEVSATDP